MRSERQNLIAPDAVLIPDQVARLGAKEVHVLIAMTWKYADTNQPVDFENDPPLVASPKGNFPSHMSGGRLPLCVASLDRPTALRTLADRWKENRRAITGLWVDHHPGSWYTLSFPHACRLDSKFEESVNQIGVDPDLFGQQRSAHLDRCGTSQIADKLD